MNKNLANLIIKMMEIDQELRYQAKPGKEMINYIIYLMDGVHNYRIKEFIKKYGYPRESIVGGKSNERFLAFNSTSGF